MRMKTIKVLRVTAQWAERILDAHLSISALYGLRTR